MGISQIDQVLVQPAKAWITLRIAYEYYTGVTETWQYTRNTGYEVYTLICPATVEGREITPDTNCMMSKLDELLAPLRARYTQIPRNNGIYYLYAYVRCNWLLLAANDDVWY